MSRHPQIIDLLVVLLGLSVAAAGMVGGVAVENSVTPGTSPPSADDSTGITTVSECQTITSPGHYRLAGDLPNRTADRCIVIASSDVVFDGAGHRIDGVGEYLFATPDGNQTSTKGIIAEDAPAPLTNVTVKNVVVTDYGYGLWYGETSDSVVRNNTFRDNGIYGIYLGYRAHDNAIVGNRVINTTSPALDVPGQGIVIANIANRNEIVDNYVRQSERHGIAIHLGNHTRIVNNTVRDSGRHGITGVGESTVIVDNVVARSGDAGINYARANGTRISGNEVRENRHGINFGRSNNALVSRNVVVGNDQHGVRLHGEVGDIDLRRNRYTDNGEWDIHSRALTAPISVENATLGDDTTASFEGRHVAVAGVSRPPEPLPDGTRAVSGYLAVRSETGEDSWLDLTLAYDASSATDGSSIGLWVYRDTWGQVPSTPVGRDPPERSTNLTESGGSLYVVVAASPESTPTTRTSPTSEPAPTTQTSPTPTGEDGRGFGVVVALLALLLAGLMARPHRG